MPGLSEAIDARSACPRVAACAPRSTTPWLFARPCIWYRTSPYQFVPAALAALPRPFSNVYVINIYIYIYIAYKLLCAYELSAPTVFLSCRSVALSDLLLPQVRTSKFSILYTILYSQFRISITKTGCMFLLGMKGRNYY